MNAQIPDSNRTSEVPGSGGLPHRWEWAGWICLVFTIASGVWLRLQWTGVSIPRVDSRFLIHAHSHLALLGWTFLAVFALVFTESSPDSRAHAPGRLQLVAESLLLGLILLIFVAFLLQGYAFWSILLSMLHILISLGLVWAYFARVRGALNERARPWVDLSMLWFAVAALGPFLLAGGGRMGQGWIEAWVGYYLTLLFNGWLIFAIVGLLAGRRLLKAGERTRWMMALGVLPTAVRPVMDWLESSPGLWAGWLGGLMFGGGLLILGGRFNGQGEANLEHGDDGFPNPMSAGMGIGGGRESWADRVLLVSVRLALLLCGTLIIVGTLPVISRYIGDTRDLFIAFTHLQLLVLVSAALVLLVFRRAGNLSVGLFLAGSWSMVAILFGIGSAQLFGYDVYLPVQQILLGTGLVVLAGVLLLRAP